ncbi:electron transport complex subunit RsxC [Candidatus Macondimonas diazotrophica]|uniref:electron transport complex subunit RsxC n=1 Tax=Candidatus Macondimonas diazotrophica TaxID=2305248 RepID=UPI0014326FA5|nr:electron transport complex subunit RsxC [Candidatus Macondimonas diazotrophica]
MATIETSRHPLHGGLALEPARPAAALPWSDGPIPSVLVLPLESPSGVRATPCVAVGDKVKRGQCIARPPGPWDAAIHASSSGEVIAIEPHLVALRNVAARACMLIRTDGEDRSEAPMSRCDPATENRAAVLRRLAESGVVGLGGAVFSTAAKLSCASATPIGTLIVNAAECEPHIRCDEGLLAHCPADIAQGIHALSTFLGQPEVLIGLKETLDSTPLAGALDAAGLNAVRIIRVPARYTAGAEEVLIRLLTGREIPRGALPTEVGCLCLNIATVAAAGKALLEGTPVISRIITASGPGLARSANLSARIGTPVSAILAACGGTTDTAGSLILGGPMMGVALPNDAIPITKGSQALWVPTQQPFEESAPVQPCIRCGACASVCPMNLLPQQLYWHARTMDQNALEAHALDACIECGCCDVVCPSRIPLVETFQTAKFQLTRATSLDQRAAWLKERIEARESRLEDRRAQQVTQSGTRGEDPRERLARLRAHRARKDATPNQEP